LKAQITLSTIIGVLFFSILVGIIFSLMGVDFGTMWGYAFDLVGSATSYLLNSVVTFIQELLFWWIP